MRKMIPFVLGCLVGAAFVGTLTAPGTKPRGAKAAEPKIDLSRPVTLVHDDGRVVTYAPHCATVGNDRVFSTGAPDRPVTVFRFNDGETQVGYTATK